MAFLKTDSLESFIKKKLIFLWLIILVLVASLCWQSEFKWQWIVLIEVLLIAAAFVFTLSVKQTVLRPFTRASLYLDAVTHGDYDQFNRPAFEQGKVGEFHRQLKGLNETLVSTASSPTPNSDAQFEWLDALELPTLIADKKQRVKNCNKACRDVLHFSMSETNKETLKSLGLVKKEERWQFASKHLSQMWQIHHSETKRADGTWQVFVFTDAKSIIYKSQLTAWQKIIRVLGHEIKNSLTPVSSIAETLTDKQENSRDSEGLRLISEQCQHLNRVFENYQLISIPLAAEPKNVSVKHLLEPLLPRYSTVRLTLNSQVETLWVDEGLMNKVLDNLLKNAFEAESTKVVISVVRQEQYHVIQLEDDGQGFREIDNAFVPFYTTKAQGQGIGLSLCRNIVEKHHGIIELHNNEKQGVTAVIILPVS